jgi:hypothetical protein
MNREFKTLTPERQEAVRRLIKAARRWDLMHSEELPCGGNAYAFRGFEGDIVWGVNDGQLMRNIARGVVREGEDL